ncbi:hypothetical protein [Thioalkalivibrio sp. ALJT]|uniref:hypothetical protein n=1 Tax=Thioalkalivibrio sp. ALJT TaxID=1158146 RepID=UPI0003674A39|nr:hypothetical protein [Thioalkalivibrio sp. ALJT]
MSELAARLRSIRNRLASLEALARDDQAAAAHRLAAELTRELNQALEAAAGPEGHADARGAGEPQAPRDPIEKCPRCTLRSFTFQDGTIRERAAEPGRYEAQYLCMSCGHEAWRRL